MSGSNGTHCIICLEGSEEQRVVFCGRCFLPVHLNCYGGKSYCDSSGRTGFLCDVCKAKHTLDSRQFCELCPTVGGAMRRTSTGKFVHVLCANVHDVFRTRRGRLHRRLDMISVANLLGTGICRCCTDKALAVSGVSVKCESGFCKQTSHVTCAQKKGFVERDRSHHDQSRGFILWCEEHCDQMIRTQRVSIYEKCINGMKMMQSEGTRSRNGLVQTIRFKRTTRSRYNGTDVKFPLTSSAEFISKYRTAIQARELDAAATPGDGTMALCSANSNEQSLKKNDDNAEDDIEYVKLLMEHRAIFPAFSPQFAAYYAERSVRTRQCHISFQRLYIKYLKLVNENAARMKRVHPDVRYVLEILNHLDIELPVREYDDDDQEQSDDTSASAESTGEEEEEEEEDEVEDSADEGRTEASNSTGPSGARTLSPPKIRRSRRSPILNKKYGIGEYVVTARDKRKDLRGSDVTNSSWSSGHSKKGPPDIAADLDDDEYKFRLDESRLKRGRGGGRRRTRAGGRRVSVAAARSQHSVGNSAASAMAVQRRYNPRGRRSIRSFRGLHTVTSERYYFAARESAHVEEQPPEEESAYSGPPDLTSPTDRHVFEAMKDLKQFWQLTTVKTCLENFRQTADGLRDERASNGVPSANEMPRLEISAQVHNDSIVGAESESGAAEELEEPMELDLYAPSCNVYRMQPASCDLSQAALEYEDVPTIGMEICVGDSDRPSSSQEYAAEMSPPPSAEPPGELKREGRKKRRKDVVQVISLEDLD